MKSINWRQTMLGDRVFTHHVTGGPLHSGTITQRGRTRVRVKFDKNGASFRKYEEVFPLREVTDAISKGDCHATVEVQP